MHAQLQYIAIKSHQPDELAQFYAEYLSMYELARSSNGDVALTDGFYNLSILKAGERERYLGFSHIGVSIDDLHEVLSRVEQFAPPHTRLETEKEDPFHGEYRLTDPNALLPVSLSLRNFGVPPLSGERQLPAIRHIALSVLNNKAVTEFFVQIFGMRPVKSGVGDGSTNLIALPYPLPRFSITEVPEGTQLGSRHTHYGMNHFGCLVPDLELAAKTLPEGRVSQRPTSLPMAEYRGLDPDDNEFDLSQVKGFEVDVDVWVQA